jgi:hypothetical protein
VANKNGSTPMQSDKSVVEFACCRSKRQRIKAVYTCDSALPDAFVGETSGKVATGIAVVNGFFTSVLFYGDSDTMRHVGGGVLNNPVTRASHSRGGGRIPRAGRLKQVWDNVSDDWLHTEDRRGVERTLILITVRLRFAQTFTTRGPHADH